MAGIINTDRQKKPNEQQALDRQVGKSKKADRYLTYG